MNKIIGLITIISASVALSSCNDMFRDQPNDKLSEDIIWSNPMLVDEYVRPWYRHMDPGFYTYVTTLMAGLGTEYEPWYTDQLTVGKRDWYQGDYGNILRSYQQTITTRGRTRWTSYYSQISSINRLLENEDKLPADMRQRVTGEAHFFRAWYYYLLLRNFGGPLIIDHTFDPLVNPEKFARASYEETVSFIAKEADLAASLLSVTNDADNAGRPTKGSALMLKGKAYFWAAGEHFQNVEKAWLGYDTDRSAELLDSAYKAYTQVVDLGVYSLIPISSTTRDEVVAEYRNIFLTKNSQESIFEVQHADDGNFDTGNGHKLDRDASAPSFGATTCAYNPTQNHVDEYRMDNGLPISDPASGYNKRDPFAGRDWRFYANILYDGAVWKGHTMDIKYLKEGSVETPGEDLTPYGTSTTAATTRTGYYMAKFLRESQVIDNDDTYASSQNCILWRYAELLLDMAEIEYKKGDIQAALNHINAIRSRVKMPEYTTITWDDIFNERRIELAFEKTTYWDLLRYNIAEERMTGTTTPLYCMKITQTASGYRTYSTTGQINGGTGTSVRYFRARQYFLPIAWDDVRYHGIEQNPEWAEM